LWWVWCPASMQVFLCPKFFTIKFFCENNKSVIYPIQIPPLIFRREHPPTIHCITKFFQPMIKIVKISVLVILCLAMFYSSMICCIYNHTVVLDSDSCVSQLSKQESQIYNCSLYILILASLALAIIWWHNKDNKY
jgi:hypothetical protein